MFIAVAAFLRYGNGYYLVGDSLGYFAHLPALVLEGSFDFHKFFSACGMPHDVFTENGLVTNIYDAGVSFFWFPFFLAALAGAAALSFPLFPLCSYQVIYFTNAGSFFLGILTVLLARDVLKHHGDVPRWTVVLSALFGTPYFFYMTFGASMSHAVSGFAIALFTWLNLRPPQEKDRYAYWSLLGLVAGLMVFVRVNNVLFLTIALIALKRERGKALAPITLLFGLGFALALLPQLVIWKTLFGDAFALPRQAAVNAGRFVPMEVLFSPFHGLLYWSPITLFSIAGFAFVFKSPRKLVPIAIGAGFLLQILLCSSLEVWWAGYSFGNRYLADSFLPVCVGLALPFGAIRSRRAKFVLASLYAALAVWTFGLFVNFDLGRLELGEIVTSGHILRIQGELFSSPLKLAKAVITPPPIFWKGFLTLFAIGAPTAVATWMFVRGRRNLFRTLLVVFLCGVFVYIALTVRAGLKTPRRPLAESEKASRIMSDDWLGYNFLLYRITEVRYLISRERIDESRAMMKEITERFHGTKPWGIWEERSGRRIDPGVLFAYLLDLSNGRRE